MVHITYYTDLHYSSRLLIAVSKPTISSFFLSMVSLKEFALAKMAKSSLASAWA